MVRGSWKGWRDVFDKWRRKGSLCDSIYHWRLSSRVFDAWKVHAVERMHGISMMIRRHHIDRLLKSSLTTWKREYHQRIVIAYCTHRMDLFRLHTVFTSWLHCIYHTKSMRRRMQEVLWRRSRSIFNRWRRKVSDSYCMYLVPLSLASTAISTHTHTHLHQMMMGYLYSLNVDSSWCESSLYTSMLVGGGSCNDLVPSPYCIPS